MPKMLLNGSWLPANYQIDYDYPKRVEIMVDKFKASPVPFNEIRIILLWEPTLYVVSNVMMYPNFYSYVFTYHDFILDNNEKAVYFMGVTTFVDPNIPHEKKFAVGTVVGDKRSPVFPGYKKRHELWFKRNQVTIPKEFYLSGKSRYTKPIIHTAYGDIVIEGELTVQQDKDHVFNTMYHIAIENVFLKNWFTEKIVDCFLTRTIPIYIGCENIGEYFNTDGIIHVKSVDEAIAVCNTLTPEYYNARLDAIEDNFNRSLKYKNFNKMLGEKVLEVLK